MVYLSVCVNSNEKIMNKDEKCRNRILFFLILQITISESEVNSSSKFNMRNNRIKQDTFRGSRPCNVTLQSLSGGMYSCSPLIVLPPTRVALNCPSVDCKRKLLYASIYQPLIDWQPVRCVPVFLANVIWDWSQNLCDPQRLGDM